MKDLSHYLHKFIHNLNKTQKQNFAKGVVLHGGNYHLQIFYFLNSQRVYDEESFKAFLKKNELHTNASKTINYLFDKLSQEYGDIHFSTTGNTLAKEWRKTFEQQMKRTEVLYKLGAVKEAAEQIEKLKKKAQKYGNPILLLRIVDLEKTYNNYYDDPSASYENCIGVVEEQLKWVKKYEYSIKQEYWYKQLIYHINRKEREEAEKIVHEYLPEVIDETFDSYHSKTLYYRAKSLYYAYTGNEILSQHILESFHTFLDESMAHRVIDRHFYITQKGYIALQKMKLAETSSEISAIIASYKYLLNNEKPPDEQNDFWGKKLKLDHKTILTRLMLTAAYKDHSFLNDEYIKTIEDALPEHNRQMNYRSGDIDYAVNLLNVTFFKIILKEKTSIASYINYFNERNFVLSGNNKVFEMNQAMIKLIYYYTYFDRRVFEVQLANLKRRKAGQSRKGITLMIAFFNAIKSDKYQLNRNDVLKYYDLLKTYESTHKTYIEVSLWLQYSFLNQLHSCTSTLSATS